MHFIKFNDQGEPSLVERIGDDIPAYGILSHTWGADDEEVTFDDFRNGTGAQKLGYGKIKFCADRSDRDGLRYFWIDTCCINKAEISRSSLRHLTQCSGGKCAATRCYVYLSDVTDAEDSTMETAFRLSRWFKRGLTLQELIAPSSVHFFSRAGKLLGSRDSRIQQIHQITGIDIEALQGNRRLSEFPIEHRISWGERRETTLEEDAAYCLLGILDVYMTPRYSEGRETALNRLRRKAQKALEAKQFGSDYTPRVDQSVQPVMQW